MTTHISFLFVHIRIVKLGPAHHQHDFSLRIVYSCTFKPDSDHYDCNDSFSEQFVVPVHGLDVKTSENYFENRFGLVLCGRPVNCACLRCLFWKLTFYSLKSDSSNG